MGILRRETEGIEFFTVQATGESGISHSGLAILCGVNQSTITRLVSKLEAITSCSESLEKYLKHADNRGFDPMRDKALKRLKAFIGKPLHLEGDFKKNGGIVKVLRADFCAATIKHYALEGREIAEQSMDKFMTLGINTWIQAITGWHTAPTIKPEPKPEPKPELKPLPDRQHILEQLQLLQHQLTIALKHRHAIHNIVEKPTVVDLSLNRIIHTAVHEQAIKLNQALENLINIQQLAQASALQKPNSSNLPQTTVTITSTTFANTPKQNHLTVALEPRIKKITAILMQFQVRKGGDRAISTCTKKATVYALYEIGHSLKEISALLQMPYETVKTYVKLTRNNLRNYFSE